MPYYVDTAAGKARARGASAPGEIIEGLERPSGSEPAGRRHRPAVPPRADFGFGGQGRRQPGDTAPAAAGMFSITSAPTIARGAIVTGHQALDGQRRDAPPASSRAMTPSPANCVLGLGHGPPRPDRRPARPARHHTRGTLNMWTTASGDEALGLVYLPLGCSVFDYWCWARLRRWKRPTRPRWSPWT
ncbi:hypothetical protein ACRAWD_14070 [Caulobacter segnis]